MTGVTKRVCFGFPNVVGKGQVNPVESVIESILVGSWWERLILALKFKELKLFTRSITYLLFS